MIKNYFKIAFRGFLKHKVFTLINIIGLSIGITASVVIYLIVQYDFSFDKFHKDSDRIYRVVTNFNPQGTPGYFRGVSLALAPAIKSQASGVEQTASLYILWPDVLIGVKGNVPKKFKAQDRVAFTDPGYFKIFNYHWLAGSPENALNAPKQVVLTSSQARLYFPTLSYGQIIGRIVTYDTLQTTVTGIVQTITENTDFTFHDFISFGTINASKSLSQNLGLTNWGMINSMSVVFIKLLPKTSPASIETQLNTILKKENPPSPGEKGNSWAFALQKLDDIHFNHDIGTFDFSDAANKTILYGLFAIAGLLLILACINFVNLTTAQASQRAKEIGIRKTMGSSRIQLVMQFLTETFLITLFAVALSVALTPSVLKLFADFIAPGINAGSIYKPNIFLFLILLTFVVSMLAGFYPAIVLSGYKPMQVLKNQSQTSGTKTRSAWLRKSLTVSQFVIAQFFVMATIMVSKQIYYALHKDLGFKKDAIIVTRGQRKEHKATIAYVLLNKLRSIPQVEMVSIGAAPPSSRGGMGSPGTFMDGKKEILTDIDLKFGDENYIKVYHIKLLAGRNIEQGDTSKAFLINDTYAKVLGFRNPADAIGRQIIKFNGHTMTIVGVMGDFAEKSLHSPITPLALQFYNYNFHNSVFHIALKPETAGGNEWATAIAKMGKAYKEIFPDDDFDYQFYDEILSRFYDSERRTSTLLSWATGLSVLISCLGLLGLAIYTTNQRTKEIGVRKIMGATVAQIVRLLSSEMVMLILLATVIVTPVAWWAMNKWMEGFADRTPISWWIFGASGAGMLLVALFASGFQTVKAARANPVKSLRTE